MSTVGVEQAGGRRRYAFALLMFLATAPAAAQSRVTEEHDAGDPEGRLLGFYSAAMAFSPAGVLHDGALLSLGLEVSYVPWLDAARRRPSIDKPEATNLAPVFPRPRIAVRLPGQLLVEGSWIPPVRVFDVEPNLFGFALSRTMATVRGVVVAPRVWTTFGRVRGAMTCNAEEMLGRGAGMDAYYQIICRGQDSDDWFEPRLFAADLVMGRPLSRLPVTLYASAGARHDRTRFDIGVAAPTGERNPDHPVLTVRSTRPQFTLGVQWRAAAAWTAGVEGFYAPGSLVTARVSARYAVWR